MKTKIFDLILNLIIILLTILVVIWFLQLIFGGSPGLEEFNFALIILLAGFFVKIYREAGVIKNDMKHSNINIKNSFINIKNDMNNIKNDMKSIKNDVNNIGDNVSFIKKKVK